MAMIAAGIAVLSMERSMVNVWLPMDSAPRDGTPILVRYDLHSNDIHGYVPWEKIHVVIAWWSGEWEMCFMEDGAADTEGYSSQFFMSMSPARMLSWMHLPLSGGE